MGKISTACVIAGGVGINLAVQDAVAKANPGTGPAKRRPGFFRSAESAGAAGISHQGDSGFSGGGAEYHAGAHAGVPRNACGAGAGQDGQWLAVAAAIPGAFHWHGRAAGACAVGEDVIVIPAKAGMTRKIGSPSLDVHALTL